MLCLPSSERVAVAVFFALVTGVEAWESAVGSRESGLFAPHPYRHPHPPLVDGIINAYHVEY